jgi:hypothetical protein
MASIAELALVTNDNIHAMLKPRYARHIDLYFISFTGLERLQNVWDLRGYSFAHIVRVGLNL